MERRLRSEEHTSELQSPCNLVCRLLLEKKTLAVNAYLTPSMQRAADRRAARGVARRRACLYRGGQRIPAAPHAGGSVPPVFFNDTATTEIYTLSLHDALPIYAAHRGQRRAAKRGLAQRSQRAFP